MILIFVGIFLFRNTVKAEKVCVAIDSGSYAEQTDDAFKIIDKVVRRRLGFDDEVLLVCAPNKMCGHINPDKFMVYNLSPTMLNKLNIDYDDFTTAIKKAGCGKCMDIEMAISQCSKYLAEIKDPYKVIMVFSKLANSQAVVLTMNIRKINDSLKEKKQVKVSKQIARWKELVRGSNAHWLVVIDSVKMMSLPNHP